ncbi:TetR/AcrR family transcriptional regulator [Massilia phyllosphaerae]|uniref:TetR/AcrR family transcriptional regulator n=1 Tax=Massilia phyllosphaerae TaxID=3106034 RepID=UPI002B1CB20C|nr:TetR/AcrR family transcriptional regulator [Massilia sp. SGZ-792]
MNAAEPIRRGAGGRPPVSRKGDVEERLLDAATRLFLASGYEGTSCDQVAQDARAGKASIYARYANKTALLKAVIAYKLGQLLEDPDPVASAGAPLRARMLHAAETVVSRLLQPDAVALLRLIVAEGPRLQADDLDAVAMLDRVGAQHIALAISAATAGAAPGAAAAAVATVSAAGAPDGAAAAVPAAALVDRVLAPALLRALLGADPGALRGAACARLAEAVDSVIASGAVDRWR